MITTLVTASLAAGAIGLLGAAAAQADSDGTLDPTDLFSGLGL